MDQDRRIFSAKQSNNATTQRDIISSQREILLYFDASTRLSIQQKSKQVDKIAEFLGYFECESDEKYLL